jgi:hypothetical protein
MSLHLSKSKIAAGWVLIALVGVVAGGFGYRSEESRKTAELIDAAKRCAVVFDGPELRKLAGARTDGQSPLYAAMKRRLIDLQAVNPRVRFVYVFRSRPETGQVSYLGDSAKPGAKDESLPGDDFPQAAESPGLQAILRTGMAATEGPLQDDFGVWITGYAPIDSAPAGKPGESSRQIVGMDIDAADWSRGLWSAAFQRAFYLWMLLGIPFGALLVMRRQLEQREASAIFRRRWSRATRRSWSSIWIAVSSMRTAGCADKWGIPAVNSSATSGAIFKWTKRPPRSWRRWSRPCGPGGRGRASGPTGAKTAPCIRFVGW